MKAHYKPIPVVESRLFKVEMQNDHTKFDYPWHYHPEYELIYIVKSQGIRYVGNNIENFFDDDLVFIGPNLPHCWINTPDQPDPPDAVVIYLKEDFMDNRWIQSSEFEAIRQILMHSGKGIKFDKSVALSLKQRYLELLTLPPLEKLMALLQILQELACTTQYRYLCEQGFSYDLNPTYHLRINTVYKYIEDHYRGKITLSDIAAKLSMNEEYFSRFFSKVMKKSFFEFLNEYKINRACRLLIETDQQVSEICYACGFESVPFFYRQFKRFKHCQPKVYRAIYQKAIS